MVIKVDLKDLETLALAKKIPIMQKEGLSFMIDRLNESQASSLLEIGSAVGYSALMMASNVEGLKIDSIELDASRYAEACQHVEAYQKADQIALHLGDALTYPLEKLAYAPYDCLFIDAAKAQYQRFFERFIDLVKPEGFVIVDNLDFHGMVNDIEHIHNRNTRALVRKIKRFKDWILHHEAYDSIYYPVGDGIVMIRKKEQHEVNDKY